jgi:hypothetical protein
MNLPEGQLRTRRVVSDLGGILVDALDWELTGYLRLESEGLLLDGGGATVLTLEAGVPVAATHTGSDRVGADALADAAVDGLYRLELRELPVDDLPAVHHCDRARVPPALPAEQLVGDSNLVARTREAAPDDRLPDAATDEPGLEAVESFLDDDEAIATIRDRARSEARERADEWGFETVDRDDPADTGR